MHSIADAPCVSSESLRSNSRWIVAAVHSESHHSCVLNYLQSIFCATTNSVCGAQILLVASACAFEPVPMNFILYSSCAVIFIAATIDETSAGNYPLYPHDDDAAHSQSNATIDADSGSDIAFSADSKPLKRSKRWYLLWQGITKVKNEQQNAFFYSKIPCEHSISSTMQCVLGFLMPVVTQDRVNWRTLNMAHNFQAQFQVLPTIIFPFKFFSRSLREQRHKYDAHGIYVPDETRSFVYNALEMYMSRKKTDGRQCLLKAICEAARQPIERRTVFDEVVHAVLTYVGNCGPGWFTYIQNNALKQSRSYHCRPNRNEVQDFYLDAKHAGGFGADCTELYPKCLPGKGLLDGISYYF